MIDWPSLDALKATLDVDSDAYDEQLANALEAGIARVKADVGSWDDYGADLPDGALANAALRAAVLLRTNATEGTDVGSDPIYRSYLHGHRRRFGFS